MLGSGLLKEMRDAVAKRIKDDELRADFEGLCRGYEDAIAGLEHQNHKLETTNAALVAERSDEGEAEAGNIET